MKKLRIIKTVLVVVLVFLLVVTTGLFVYGVIQGPQRPVDNSAMGVGKAPSADLGFADPSKKVNVSAITTSGMSKSEQVANMIVSASYNNILIDQFYFATHVDIHNKSKDAFSDYYRVKTGANMFYQAYAYTGTINTTVVRIDYGDQRLSQSNTAKYDKDEKKWSASLKDPEVKDYEKEASLPDLNPYNIYSWYDFPIDLGGIKSCHDKEGSVTEGRTEAIDYSIIDNDSVKITLMQDEEGNEYYRITFDANIKKAQASQETRDRFAESFDSLKDVEFYELHFAVEIWKDLGVFRQIYYNARIRATISGDRGEANITKEIQFSYEDEDASVADRIKRLAGSQTQKWYKKWSDTNKEKIDAEYEALQAKIAAKKAAEEAAKKAEEEGVSGDA